MDDSTDEIRTDERQESGEAALAAGGGNATAAGVTFQGALGALFATAAIADRPLDARFGIGAVRVRALRFETEAPLDDILVATNADGYVFTQAKTSLTLAKKLDSELGKTAEQVVRQWRACVGGDGSFGWNRPLTLGRDLFLIAVGPRAAGTVANDLAQALSRRRGNANRATTPATQRKALESFSTLLETAWQEVVGSPATSEDIAQMLDLTAVVRFDLEGPDAAVAIEMLKGDLLRPDDAPAALEVLGGICEQHMAARTGADTRALRRSLEEKSIRLLAPPDYRTDVEAFRADSGRNRNALASFEAIRIDGEDLTVPRQCMAAALNAAQDGSFLLVGEPGAGKSAVLNILGRTLSERGSEVLQLSVDRVPVTGLDGLRTELGLSHPIRDVLQNWPGAASAFLLIDSLDAVRGGAGELVFKSLIEEVMSLPGGRWRIIASVRSFDLRLGTQFRLLFPGGPPAPEFANPDFGKVRHVQVSPWTNEELDDLLARAPRLSAAIVAGGQKLRNLALVPFNTKLLADLISDGLVPAALGSLRTQSELLDLYWQHRVQVFAPDGDACLRAVLQEMVNSRSLRASQDTAFRSGGNGLLRLLGSGVLVEQSGGRHVAFRHHILFDYAASRLYLNPFDSAGIQQAFLRASGLGLLLGPALGYALQELWNSNADRKQYWDTVAQLIGDRTVDPIARSIAARSSSELPVVRADTGGLIHQLVKDGVGRSIFASIIGSLGIWNEDHPDTVPLAPWAQVAVEASKIPDLIGVIGFLLGILMKQTSASGHQNEFGTAARNLLEAAFAHNNNEYSSGLAAVGIQYVAETYASDSQASRALLGKVFTADRFDAYAHVEVPAVARQIATIKTVDPEFAITIYGEVFSHRVTSQQTTRMSDSQIMPFMSHVSQDYEMARYQLAHYFPELLKDSPLEGTKVLIQAIDGITGSEHAQREPHGDWTLKVGNKDVRVTEDLSHIWAWDVVDTHPDNAMILVQAFVQWLRSASPEEAAAVVELFFTENHLALLWTRLFMVAAERPEAFGYLLWDLVTKEKILLSSDLRKDAIDLIAALYPNKLETERTEFEEAILQTDFSGFVQPEKAKTVLLSSLFQAIGQDYLVTEAARALLESATEQAPLPNSRPFSIEGGPVAMEEYWWLHEQNIEVEAPANAAVLAHTKSVKAALGLRDAQPLPTISDVPAALNLITGLETAMQAAEVAGVPLEVLRVAAGAVVDGCSAILSGRGEQALTDESQIESVKGITLRLSHSHFPVGSAAEEARFERSQSVGGPAPRVDAARNLVQLCQLRPQADAEILARIEQLLSDPHPAVRGIVASTLSVLWRRGRETMWKLADWIAQNEPNKAVLSAFTQFLGNVRNADPEHVETSVLTLRDRLAADPVASDARRGVRENVAALLAMLYVWNDRPQCGSVVREWCTDLVAHETDLDSALSAVRGALIDGYADDSPAKQGYRQRSQELVARVVDSTSDWLAAYFAQGPGEQSQQKDEATSVAKTLDHTCSQLYFASGAFHAMNPREPAGMESLKEKIAFLGEVEPILRRMGDLGAAHTIYHLLQILEFLLPANPGRIFDLIAHALLEGGKRQGYQFDSMGADVFVRIVGVCLADHRDIFRDEPRRQALVDCLDVFIEAGWPSARRLIHRLPELFD
jgi:hypothetical protein